VPELPEVETTRRGLSPFVTGVRIAGLVVRNKHLRWPIADELPDIIRDQTISHISRRSKYLLFHLDRGALIAHLGMSGSLRVIASSAPPGPWDPFDIVLAGPEALCLRLRDPRRFGALLYSTDPFTHPLIASLGPEPLDPDFQGSTLYARARGRTLAIRDFLLNGRIVAGIGNIYANEALFLAGIRPDRSAGRISRVRFEALASAIVTVLTRALEAGGTTLKDFAGGDGRPGYFQQQLQVYGRTGEPCYHCAAPIRRLTESGRSSFYCPECQH
jgi:formamidopyrimidine-DNA glycosylase